MAAGVSIVVCLLLEILCLSITSAGIQTINGNDPHYVVLGSNGVGNLEVDDIHSSSRVRRQVDASVSPPAVTTNSTPVEEGTEAPPASTKTPAPSSTTTTTTTTTTTSPTPETTPEETITTKMNDKYYQWKAAKDKDTIEHYWLTEEVLDAQGKQTHGTLSNSHRTAGTIKLSFPFLFYGHEVQQVTVATGGFIYVSDFVHQWLTATQYVAPLMANFDSTLGNNSFVHYRDNGTAFTVWWEDLHLQDQKEEGTFSFQASLHSDGTIVFSYKDIALSIDQLSTGKHPVKIGLSDAYYIDKKVKSDGRYHTRRTIYEYDQVNIQQNAVANNTVIIVTPKTTCNALTNCSECMSAEIGFRCRWCHDVQRCSDGNDRHRQTWLEEGCHNKKEYAEDHCFVSHHSHKFISVGAIVAIIILLSIVFLLVAWLVYAYRNPQSKSGIWLIEHRPSQLKAKLSRVRFWSRSEAGDKYQVTMQPDGESVA